MRSRLKLLIASAVLAVLATLAGGTFHLVDRGERAALALADTLLDANAQAVENALNRQLLQADGALASLPALFAGVSVTFDGEVTAAAASQLLRGLNFQAFSFRDLMLIQQDGSVWASAKPRPARRNGTPDGAAFVQAEGSASVSLVGPVRNKMTGDWSLFLSRPISLPGHNRLQAVAEISLPTLVSLLGEARLDPAMRVALERRSGELVASLPHDELAMGQVRAPSAATFAAAKHAFLLPGNLSIDRALAVVKHSVFSDLFVIVSLEERRALADWRQDRDRMLLAGGLAALFTVGLGAALLIASVQREKLSAERARAAAVLENAMEAMSDGFVMWDRDDRLVTCNEQYRRHYEVSRPFLVPGTSFEEIIRKGAEAGQYPAAADGEIDAFVNKIVNWHRGAEGQIERLLPDGRWLLITERRMADGGIVGIRTDITALKGALADLARETERANEAAAIAQEQNSRLKERDLALHTRNALFEAALDNMSHGLVMVDGNERVIVGNRRFCDLFGLDEASLLPGMSAWTAYTAAKAGAALEAQTLDEIRNHHRRLADRNSSGTFVCATPEGKAIAVTQRPLEEGGWIAIYEDVTSQREAESLVRFLAHHDDLTKLPNRNRFRLELDERLSGKGPSDGPFALLYLDLDRFKDVNDTLGHPAGDVLLKEVARRLSRCVGPDDVVARLGGDEFAVIHPLGASAASPEDLSRQVIATIGEAFSLSGRQVTVGASVGIAIATGERTTADTLLKNADIALYQAKEAGRGSFCLFAPELEQKRSARFSLEADLRRAIETEAFTLAYQPIFNLERQRVVSFEALIRWQHPERGWVGPGEFVPVAEEAGLINEIGAWVLRRACLDTALLPDGIGVAVNLSPQQLRSDAVVDVVTEALRLSALAPHRLELEITETALLADTKDTAALLGRLRALGPHIVLDDFGTGYSSLSHLRTFPLSKIKIDQSFVREMTSTRQSAAIVTSVVEMATRLGMRTTAEGVETQDLLDCVRQAGCTEAQGYLLGRPRSILHAFEAIRTRMDGSTPDTRLSA